MKEHSIKSLAQAAGLPEECAEGCDESHKDDIAFDESPVQCTTGADGTCELHFGGGENGSGFADDDVDPSGDEYEPGDSAQWTALVDGSPRAGSLVSTVAQGGGCPLGDQCSLVTGQFSAGDFVHYVLAYPAGQQSQVLAALGQNDAVKKVEPDNCGEKELPMPRQYSGQRHVISPAYGHAEPVGQATLELD